VEWRDDVAWDLVSHAYGPAVEVPSWLEGLRDPDRADESLEELFVSLLHQGTHYSATALVVPYLVDAALDPQVLDRVGAVAFLHNATIVDTEGHLDWKRLREAQDERFERDSWDAVVAEHARLRLLLDENDRRLARTTLRFLLAPEMPMNEHSMRFALRSHHPTPGIVAPAGCVPPPLDGLQMVYSSQRRSKIQIR
jgi:hypothetical protein